MWYVDVVVVVDLFDTHPNCGQLIFGTTSSLSPRFITELGGHYTKRITLPLLWILWWTQLLLSGIPTPIFTTVLLYPNSSGEGGNETIILHNWRAAGDIIKSAARTTAGYYELRLW